jgi:hypothetical protein
VVGASGRGQELCHDSHALVCNAGAEVGKAG